MKLSPSPMFAEAQAQTELKLIEAQKELFRLERDKQRLGEQLREAKQTAEQASYQRDQLALESQQLRGKLRDQLSLREAAQAIQEPMHRISLETAELRQLLTTLISDLEAFSGMTARLDRAEQTLRDSRV
jgi:hypothetical protein